ncbi:hypothetical protein DPSP01_007164 [Paraphaeosphaeria sporulosa]|uniref:Uncharacterized protein n=1 Tax=Paraphaeosphaeria sporulosa TaxID=1460663 RepID=A0A177CPU5_9PLEO|nr:uncharacterized protein CC84DRAFT_1215269 [Paraphaeosphaeria sporulosa]OAG08799.1 hypothetical protein CC84DRAFT_1215269 [Paraphaeosphaeria sporulosa]
MPDPQLAHLLSDLVSLRLTDPAAALALVSARPTSSTAAAHPPNTTSTDANDANEDTDIARAKELVALHYAVKEAHRRGELAAGLAEARASVERAVGGIGS